MLRRRVEEAVREALRKRRPEADLSEVRVEAGRGKEHGDFAVNAAFVLAKQLRVPPRTIAGELAADLEGNPLFARVETAGPGFLNLTLHPSAYHELLAHILAENASYGRSRAERPSRLQIEFVSANPTGPLNVVSARAAAVGDTLARLFEATGTRVEREFYVNDHGTQVDRLVDSVLWHREGGKGTFPEEGYRGAYVETLARESERALDALFPINASGLRPEDAGEILTAVGAIERGEIDEAKKAAAAAGFPLPARVSPEAFRVLLRAWLVERVLRGQREGLAAFSVRFDRWYRESELHASDAVNRTLDILERAGDLYEKEGARWFRSSRYGDDEDRVVVRSTGQPTYFLADIAYHADKAARRYDHVIDILGPDHHGHVPRMQAAVQSLGKEMEWLEILIVQQVNLLRGGETVKMSKRAGEFVTLEDLLEEVGTDAARFFFVMLRPNSHLNFDLDLAKSRSLDNPVYYVQYAHARISSVFAHARAAGVDPERIDRAGFETLAHEAEIDLLRLLDAYPDTVAGAASTREPHRIPAYLRDLASRFHAYYHRAKIVGEREEVTGARLALARAVRIVIRNGLDLLGVSAPESM
ncbi:MAG: arginine--tRNA ligase [Candidatus Eisenbacteria bacterium]|nr:arginine--tRNA ligase [Candidatus Eisenbacteria bacterium]